MRVGTWVALGALVALLAAGGARAGGTYRVGWEPARAVGGGNFDWGDGFDPTGEWSFGANGIYSNLLLRTLVGYDHVSGAAGYRLVPDLAESVPAPTDGGLTYTFRLRRGLRFGPPVGRAVVAGDVRYAIERLARPRNVAQYAWRFKMIAGFDAYRAGRARSISGIATPDARTIVFQLTRPTADFPHRLTLPATGPIPREVARCFEGKPGGYGADLVSTGPYMLEGAGAVSARSCAALKPMRGLTAGRMTLVRNPAYDPRTDTRAARENAPDRFVFRCGARNELLRELNAGELEDAYFESGPTTLGRYAARAARHGLLHVEPQDFVFFVALNLTRPPFDDVHVRRALAWALDTAALRDAFGGPAAGPIAGHIVPDALLGGRLAGFDPFHTGGEHGDLVRARAELRRSRYGNAAGRCAAPGCRRIRLGVQGGPYAYPAGQRMVPVLKAALADLGITVGNGPGRPEQPSSNKALVLTANWWKDYADPADYFDPLLLGTGISASDNLNYSLAGITPAQAKRLGVSGHVRGVPSFDGEIARCQAAPDAQRTACWARLDRRVSGDVVPWIPYLWRSQIEILGPQVAKWQWDQAVGTTAYAHVAVKP